MVNLDTEDSETKPKNIGCFGTFLSLSNIFGLFPEYFRLKMACRSATKKKKITKKEQDQVEERLSASRVKLREKMESIFEKV